jgi:hypothetical protein
MKIKTKTFETKEQLLRYLIKNKRKLSSFSMSQVSDAEEKFVIYAEVSDGSK